MKDIVVVGLGQSDLDDYLIDVSREAGRYVSPDPTPAAGHYFRSDHFNFAKIGIPALYTDSGIDHVDSGKDYGNRMVAEYIAERYHQQSDEFDSTTWNLEGGIDDLKLLFEVGRRLASESTWPEWKAGSEFKSIREQYRP
jgi:Zn-dependent M28 family amino/carboxypeptidase